MARVGDKIGGKKIISICGLHIYFEDCSWAVDTSQFKKPKKVLKKKFKDKEIQNLNNRNQEINESKKTEAINKSKKVFNAEKDLEKVKTEVSKKAEKTKVEVKTEVPVKVVKKTKAEELIEKEKAEDKEFLKHLEFSGMK